MNDININKNRILWSLFIAFVLIFFLHIGGILQVIFLNIFNTDVSNLYDLFMPNQVFEKIKFIDFIFNLSIIEFITMFSINYIITYKFLKFQSGIRFYLNLSFVIAICFILMDLTILLHERNFKEFDYFANFLSNIIGGFFLALIMTIFLWISNKIINPSIKYSLLYKNLFFFTLCFISILIIYFIFTNVFQSSSTKIKAEIKTDLAINYINADSSENSENNFGLNKGKKIYLKNLEYIGMNDLDINYKYNGNNDLEIFFFDGCAGKKSKEFINLKTFKIKIPNNNSYNIMIKEGYTHFKNGFNDTISAVTFDKLTQKKQLQVANEKKDKFYISYFLADENEMKILSDKNLDFYRFDIALLGKNGISDREILLKNINKKVTIKPNKKININDPLICKPASIKDDEIFLDSPTATIIIKTSKNITFTEIGKESELSLSELTGWINGSNLNTDELSAYIDNGKVKNISLVGNFISLFIENEKVELNNINNLSLTNGSIDLSMNNGILKINADVDVAYFDGDRVSKTRWEKISIYVKGIIAFLGTGVIYLLRRFYTIIKNDEDVLNL
ncbi:hypothetical protein ACG94V_07015 [Acinetobacter sp. ULE_I001]|uniref:hypothetical protein n=1 Tax=unclassified Acinetobacter TaxID=196816 RepID=UPI003AF82004